MNNKLAERLSSLATSHNLKIGNPADAVTKIGAAVFGFTAGTHTVVKDDEILPALKELADRRETATLAKIHEVNRGLVGTLDPEMLSQLGALPWSSLSSSTRMSFDRNFRAHGHVQPSVNKAVDRVAEGEARAAQALSEGRDVAMDASGNLTAVSKFPARDRMDAERPAAVSGFKPTGVMAKISVGDIPAKLSSLPLHQAHGLLRAGMAARQALRDAGDNIAPHARARLVDAVTTAGLTI